MDEIAGDIERVIRGEGEALRRLADSIPAQAEALSDAVGLVAGRCAPGGTGRLVPTGVGKAGHVARKLAATFSSLGTAAGFLDPGGARHGDLGLVQGDDLVLALSNSGRSEELLALLPELARRKVPLLALVGRPDSPLAAAAAVVLDCGRHAEPCHLGLAPTASTAAMLALGDALAVAVSRRRGFAAADYARNHPGGALGRRLLAVGDVMRTGERLVAVAPETATAEAIQAVSRARVGSAVLVDPDGTVRGILTDGDLRRALDGVDDPGGVMRAPIAEHATCPCLTVPITASLPEALRFCADRRINELPVCDADGHLHGLLDIQDLVDRGFEVEDG